MSHKDLRSIVRRKLEENYPAGASDNPDAPWNQEDSFVSSSKKISNSLNFVAGDSESEFLVKSSGRFYVISVQNIKINPELQSSLTAEYGEASPESQGDEDGQYDSYDYESTELDQSQIMNAAEDHIEQGKASTPEEYAAGEGFVYHLTPAMAEELWSSGSDLEHAPQVNRMIDYGKLRQAYPQAF